MKIIEIAPLFDYGNSMFYAGGIKGTRASLLETKITGIAKTEEKILRYITNPDIVNLNHIPSPEEVLDFYARGEIPEEHAEVIAHNYRVKRDIVFDMQNGMKISLYQEKKKETAYKPHYEKKNAKTNYN